MTHISGFERSQILLLPEAVDDYVDADNPVRFIDAFVDELDLSAAGFVRVAAKATPPRLCASRSVEALHLRLFEPGAVEPSAGDGEPPQHRGDLAASEPEARLQDHRRLSARQPGGLPVRVPSVRAALPAARPFRTRVAGRGRNPDQGGQQQGSQFYAQLAGKVHS